MEIEAREIEEQLQQVPVPVPVHSQYNNTQGSRVLASNSQNHYHIMLYMWYVRFINTEFGIVPNTDGIRDIFFLGIRDIVLDIWKYEFLVLGTLSLIILGTMSLIPIFISGIYIQIGIDWNQFPAGKRIDYD